MKILSTFAMSRIGIVSLLSLCVIIFSISFITISDQTVLYKSFNSSISIANVPFNEAAKVEANSINCEANFVFDEGKLTDISGFNFDVELSQFDSSSQEMELVMQTLSKGNGVDKITFNQEKVMVLPTMKMIHLIGTLNIANVNRPAAFQFAYSINKDKSISISGKQTVNLAEFGLKLPNDGQGTMNNEISMNLNFKMVDEELILPKSKFAMNY